MEHIKHIINRIEPTVSGPQNIDIYEHRAPTDESIKLLKEMQEKALDSLIYHEANEGIKNNAFSYSFDIVAGGPNPNMFNNKMLIFTATINGKQYKVKKYLHELGDKAKVLEEYFNGDTSKLNKCDLTEIRLLMLSLLLAQAIIDGEYSSKLYFAMNDCFY